MNTLATTAITGTLSRTCTGAINDQWLKLCERSFRPEFSLEKVCIPMEPVERQHLDIIEKLLGADDLQDLVGPRCLAMLKSGLKLEVEGASNPSIYKRDFPRRLREHLLGTRL